MQNAFEIAMEHRKGVHIVFVSSTFTYKHEHSKMLMKQFPTSEIGEREREEKIEIKTYSHIPPLVITNENNLAEKYVQRELLVL